MEIEVREADEQKKVADQYEVYADGEHIGGYSLWGTGDRDWISFYLTSLGEEKYSRAKLADAVFSRLKEEGFTTLWMSDRDWDWDKDDWVKIGIKLADRVENHWDYTYYYKKDL